VVATYAPHASYGYAVYDCGRLLVEVFDAFCAVLVVGGLVIMCVVADSFVPRADGDSWFVVLIDLDVGLRRRRRMTGAASEDELEKACYVDLPAN
jgi:hypothetical protein